MTTPALTAVPPQAPPPQAPQAPQLLRPGRALIGWMRPDQAHGLLQPSMPEPTLTAGVVQRAHEAVAARAAGVDQDALITSVPAELAEHVKALDASPAAKPMHDEGWKVALVDLTRVCAFQPAIVSDQALARVQAAGKDDLVSVAAITLPLTQGDQLPVQYDPIHQAWTVTSANPNLRIAGHVGPLPVGPGAAALGFAVVAGPSFLQVGRYNGRHYLRDGYHRAFGLLSCGISIVPAFVRDITRFEELMADPRTMLPQDAYQGERPPVLTDYLDSTVSAAVQLPAVHKMIIIQGLELAPIG
jgi:hypothetical protein